MGTHLSALENFKKRLLVSVKEIVSSLLDMKLKKVSDVALLGPCKQKKKKRKQTKKMVAKETKKGKVMVKGKTSGKKRRNQSHSPNSETHKKVRKIEKSNSTRDDRESNSDRHDRERRGRPPNHSM